MTNSKLKHTLLATLMMAGGLLAGTGAFATPGTVFTGTDFLEFDPDSVDPAVGPGGFLTATPTELSWVDTGDPTDAHSFLRILPPSNTPVPLTSDSGIWVDVAQIEHENNVIPVDNFSFSVNLIDNFTLEGATFALTGTDSLPEVTLDVNFTETSNTEPCPAPNPLGSTCDDIFAVPNLDAVINTFLFTALGEQWELSFRLFASEDAGTFFDGEGNIIFTSESDTSQLFVQAMINQVPEPATLTLLGLGLLGAMAATARHKATKA